MADFPIPRDDLILTYFVVADDIDRSKDFYTHVLGGEVALEGTPTIVQLANTWIIINSGGGPTEDKPDVTLEAPQDLTHVNSFLNIRVADIEKVYAEWTERGGVFLTPPVRHEREMRAYLRDPDGHLIEVGQFISPEH